MSLLIRVRVLEFVKRLSDDVKVAPFVEKATEKFIRAEFLSEAEEETNNEAITYVADLLSVLPRDRRERILEDTSGQFFSFSKSTKKI